jgi:hypothetical protein
MTRVVHMRTHKTLYLLIILHVGRLMAPSFPTLENKIQKNSTQTHSAPGLVNTGLVNSG